MCWFVFVHFIYMPFHLFVHAPFFVCWKLIPWMVPPSTFSTAVCSYTCISFCALWTLWSWPWYTRSSILHIILLLDITVMVNKAQITGFLSLYTIHIYIAVTGAKTNSHLHCSDSDQNCVVKSCRSSYSRFSSQLRPTLSVPQTFLRTPQCHGCSNAHTFCHWKYLQLLTIQTWSG